MVDVEIKMRQDPAYMSEALCDVADDTMIMFVGLDFDLFAGYGICLCLADGSEFDKFLLADGRLVFATAIGALASELPPEGGHTFAGDKRFAEFCARMTRCYGT